MRHLLTFDQLTSIFGTLSNRLCEVIAHTRSRLSLSSQALSRAQRHRSCPPHCKLIATCPAQVGNVIAHAHLTATRSCHAQWCAECYLAQSGQPNRRLQRTALRAHEIVRFLKGGFGSTAFSI
jgi:hypothetical protein